VTKAIYLSLVKGFSAKSDMLEAIYLEMRKRRIGCDYNYLIIAFCVSGNLDRALELQKEMHGKFDPSVMMYSSLLDGCASAKRPCLSDALRLVEDMRENGVKPCHYTQNMLVKLYGRCQLLDQAFSVIDEFKAEFGLSPSIEVCNCLMQGSFQNKQPAKALLLLDRMSEYGLCPDQKTYRVLVLGHLHMGQIDKAVEWVESACQGESPVGVDSQCLKNLLCRLGCSEKAADVKKLVKEAWHRQQVRGRQAAHAQLGSEMKATSRSGTDSSKESYSGSEDANSQVLSVAEARKVQAAKPCKRLPFPERTTSSWSPSLPPFLAPQLSHENQQSDQR
jgi:pentatricopeptide repeat protein